jgi:hypothetical protein
VRDFAWLDLSRSVALLDISFRRVGRYDLLALFEGSRLLAIQADPGFRGDVTGLQVSPSGRHVAVQIDNPSNLAVFDRDGRGVPVPPITDPHAFTFSPDGEWLAVATRASIHLFRVDRPQIFRLGITTSDVGWIR